ncbi:hypothetical protein Tco_0116397 [Tanacetum coccineum]
MRPRCRYNPCNFSDDSDAAVTRHELDCRHMDIPETLEEKLARVERMRKRNADRNARTHATPLSSLGLQSHETHNTLLTSSGLHGRGRADQLVRVAPPQPILPLHTASSRFRQATRSFRVAQTHATSSPKILTIQHAKGGDRNSLHKSNLNSAKSRRYVSSTDSDRVVMVFTRSLKLRAPEEATRVPETSLDEEEVYALAREAAKGEFVVLVEDLLWIK